MAHTISDLRFDHLGSSFANRATVTFSGTYPSGGEVITLGEVGLSVGVDDVVVSVIAGTPGLDIQWSGDSDSIKLVVFEEDADGESAEFSGSISNVSARILAVGS